MSRYEVRLGEAVVRCENVITAVKIVLSWVILFRHDSL